VNQPPAQTEIGATVSQHLDRRTPDEATLVKQIAARDRRRNAETCIQ
jgi:hypothetical protein